VESILQQPLIIKPSVMKNIILLPGMLLFLLTSCEKDSKECPGAIEKSFSLSGFNKINVGGTFTVNVVKGNDFSIKASGCADDIADLDVHIEPGNSLDIEYDRYKPGRYRVDFTITLPQLVSLNLSGVAKGTVNGFQGQNTVIRSIISGEAVCNVFGTGINAQVELSGEATLHLSGATQNLYGTISGNSRLEATEVAADEVDISASGTSKVYVRPLQSFFAEVSGESRVYYHGNPPVKHFVSSGNGKVIQQ
jgi:hypothetical protein